MKLPDLELGREETFPGPKGLCDRLARGYRNWYNAGMERVVRKFASHVEADEADREYYLSLTPQQRMDIMLELVRRYQEGFGNEVAKGLQRIYCIRRLGDEPFLPPGPTSNEHHV
jgi:hypothetical protein